MHQDIDDNCCGGSCNIPCNMEEQPIDPRVRQEVQDILEKRGFFDNDRKQKRKNRQMQRKIRALLMALAWPVYSLYKKIKAYKPKNVKDCYSKRDIN